jgi:hypothetical protein
VAAGRIRPIENYNDLNGNRTRDLPARTILPPIYDTWKNVFQSLKIYLLTQSEDKYSQVSEFAFEPIRIGRVCTLLEMKYIW